MAAPTEMTCAHTAWKYPLWDDRREGHGDPAPTHVGHAAEAPLTADPSDSAGVVWPPRGPWEAGSCPLPAWEEAAPLPASEEVWGSLLGPPNQATDSAHSAAFWDGLLGAGRLTRGGGPALCFGVLLCSVRDEVRGELAPGLILLPFST